MRMNKKYIGIAFVIILAFIATKKEFNGPSSDSKDSKIQFQQEVIEYSKVSKDIDIWTGKIRAFEKNQALRGIIIEGMIEDGDFKRFVQVAKLAGPELSTVYLFSPGGKAIEAMKIGTLIRMLRYNTEVWPFDMSGERKCFFEDVDPKYCTCESACFLVFVGGVYRFPNMLGVHRVYLDHDTLRSVESSDAIGISKTIRGQVSQYLVDMGTPSSVIEKMFAVPSNQMEYLSPSELDQFKGEIEDIDEWVSAKCPELSVEESRDHLVKRGWNMKLFENTKDDFIISTAQNSCRSDILDNLTKEGWSNVFDSGN